ncbi:tRNA-splicing endonuclease subunit Sen34-like isoform X2 [Pomacea canaliculata]|uniref:tRNA-splicing endonuclease subunit Sen34-like isoform X2 n=1 Tax=Pomacea canaliculata TaxID=400727 RepID=UPI000D72F6D0|nr:tRNA-splicing endonuclease subunit Sen34-like isoform X2 [Pomacea canaliculata]
MLTFVDNMATEACLLPTADEQHVLDDCGPIAIHLRSGQPTVWNPKDALRLREKYRIVGVLTGCLPRAPRQNVHLGLPLQLMSEELTLLLEKGFAELLKDKPVSEEQIAKRVKIMQALKTKKFQEQQDLYKQERQQEMIRQLPNIIEGKKAKRQHAKSSDDQTDSIKEELLNEELEVKSMPLTPTPEKHMLVQLLTENPWENDTMSVEEDWAYPTTSFEKLRYAVFKDLWEKGFYLTSGQKFGGDFLAYPGDPSRFHSFYIVICVDYTQDLYTLDIISMGRLGSNVRKTVLLSSQDVNGQLSLLYHS